MQEENYAKGRAPKLGARRPLAERAAAIDGLGDAERKWIAASTGDWQTRSDDAESASGAGESSRLWHDQGGDGSRDPDDLALAGLPELSSEHERALSRASIDTVGDIVDADLQAVASTTGYDVTLLRHWRFLVRTRLK